MSEIVPGGSWVEIEGIVLAPGERAPQVPEDTRLVPLQMRVKGFLLHDARPGDAADIRTAAGRRLHGTLRRANPGYGHGFGAPIPALAGIAEEVRALLAGDGETS